jgi:hypothetical protein
MPVEAGGALGCALAPNHNDRGRRGDDPERAWLLSFPKAPNDDTSDSAAYQLEIAQPPAGMEEQISVTETRRRLTENQSR